MTMESFLPLYLSLVRPILEYAVQAVSPYLQKDIDLTERLPKFEVMDISSLVYLPFARGLGLGV